MALLPQVFDDSTGNIILTTTVAWPIGAVFISTLASNPAVILGYGTWIPFGQGRLLIGLNIGVPPFDTIGNTGGSQSHTLTVPELPAHHHRTPASTNPTVGSEGLMGSDGPSDDFVDGDTTDTGMGNAFNIMNPYIIVAMWLRTA